MNNLSVLQAGVSGPLPLWSEPIARPLSGREREVLSLVAEGYSNRLIASQLVISERTVKTHLTAIMTKLDAADRTHAFVTAWRMGCLLL